MGRIVTFYSFKGGVGRTMALANVAALLARWGRKVLVIDWDLEAPGLEMYFGRFIDERTVHQRRGLSVMLLGFMERGASELELWGESVIPVALSQALGCLHVLTAGCRDATYHQNVGRLDVSAFYGTEEGWLAIENLRDAWKAAYDFVL